MGRKKAKGVGDWMAGSAAQPVTSRGRAQLPRSPNEILEPVRPAPPARGGRSKAHLPNGPRRGRATVGFLNSSLTILLVFMVLAGGSAYALKYAFEQPGPLDHSTIVVIPQGEGLTGIASRLQREGVVTDSRVLLAGYYWSRTKIYFTGGRAPALKAGEYEIRKGASMRQVIDTLVEGKAAGATLLCGGKREGAMLEATLLENVPRTAKAFTEEAFGPIANLSKFSDFKAALAEVNDSKFGLQAGIFTRDIFKALDAWDHLDVGGVVIGDVPSYRVDNMPYGGVKDSGLGREGVRFAMEDMTEIRNLVIRRR